MGEYLQATRLVDLDASTVRETAARLARGAATPREAAIKIYNFCRAVQWGVMPPLAYRFAPDKVTHTWVEAHLNDRWIVLEGVIMDKPYFLAARRLLLESSRSVGYAIGLPPETLAGCANGCCIDWDGAGDVISQMTAVVADLGPAADPEEFYRLTRFEAVPDKGWGWLCALGVK